MAYIIENNQVVSFAEYDDIYQLDQRLFDSNEGLTDTAVEAQLKRATERVLDRIRSTSWWRSYYQARTIQPLTTTPPVDINRIVGRQNDFRDLAIYTALGEYILPSIADFSDQENAERQKMGYYTQRSEVLFGELIAVGDWYDFDNDGTVEDSEIQGGANNPRRIR
jgi:hypothetical protein